jgi:hypothetical protein
VFTLDPSQSFNLNVGDTHTLSSAVATDQFVYFNSSTTSLTPDPSAGGDDNTSLNLLSTDVRIRTICIPDPIITYILTMLLIPLRRVTGFSTSPYAAPLTRLSSTHAARPAIGGLRRSYPVKEFSSRAGLFQSSSRTSRRHLIYTLTGSFATRSTSDSAWRSKKWRTRGSPR